MSKIRINELARQLEVKSREVIDKLHELGIAEKVTHSSSIDEDKADQIAPLLPRRIPSACRRDPAQRRHLGNRGSPSCSERACPERAGRERAKPRKSGPPAHPPEPRAGPARGSIRTATGAAGRGIEARAARRGSCPGCRRPRRRKIGDDEQAARHSAAPADARPRRTDSSARRRARVLRCPRRRARAPSAPPAAPVRPTPPPPRPIPLPGAPQTRPGSVRPARAHARGRPLRPATLGATPVVSLLPARRARRRAAARSPSRRADRVRRRAPSGRDSRRPASRRIPDPAQPAQTAASFSRTACWPVRSCRRVPIWPPN